MKQEYFGKKYHTAVCGVACDKVKVRWFLKYLALVGLLLAAGWFSASPSWAAAVALVTTLGAFLALDFKLGSTNRTTSATHDFDASLFAEIVELLHPNSKCLTWLRDGDMAAAFPKESVRPLYRFRSEFRNSNCESIDRDLEKQRQRLFESVESFLALLAEYTFPDRSMLGWYTMEYSMQPETEMLRDTRNRLNALAGEVFENHQEFVRTGRLKFQKSEFVLKKLTTKPLTGD